MRSTGRILAAGVLFSAVAWSSPAAALANRVFVSAQTGNNANNCASVSAPCQTFAGALTQLNPDGEIIVLDSGGYGPLTITQGVSIEAPPGVTAFIHPPSGTAITINAPGSRVTLRGLVLNVGTAEGIDVLAVGTLNVIRCFISGFAQRGIRMGGPGLMNLQDSDVRNCDVGVALQNSTGTASATVDRCHFDGNTTGFAMDNRFPGVSLVTATASSADLNLQYGWSLGSSLTGPATSSLDSCRASGNGLDGVTSNGATSSVIVRFSNCFIVCNGHYGVNRSSVGPIESRGTSTITANGFGDTNGTIVSFPGI
jgi:hypothetical protein